MANQVLFNEVTTKAKDKVSKSSKIDESNSLASPRIAKQSKRDFSPVHVPRGRMSVWYLFLLIAASIFTVLYTFVLASSDSFEAYSPSSMKAVFLFFIGGIILTFLLTAFTYGKLRNSKFELRKRCVRYIVGRYWIKQEVIEINYQDIGWVRVSQSLLERVFNIGTLEIGAAHSHVPEISVHGRKDPHKYANKIHKRLVRDKKPVAGASKQSLDSASRDEFSSSRNSKIQDNLVH